MKDFNEIIEMVKLGKISQGDRERLATVLERGSRRREGLFPGFLDVDRTMPGGEPVPVSPYGDKPDRLAVEADDFDEVRIYLPGRYDLDLSREEGPAARVLIAGDSREGLEAFREGRALVLQPIGEDNYSGGNLAIRMVGPRPLEVYLFQGDGHLRGEKLSGRFTFKSRSAKVFIEDVEEGDLWLSTVDGDLEVSDFQGDLTLLSVSGDVQAADAEGNLRLHCSSGDIYLENAQGKMKLFNCSGDVEGENLEGNLQVVSASGDLEFFDVEGVIRLETHSGDVGLEKALGCFRISTTSGDVECVEVTVEEGEIRSISGDLELEVEHLEEGAPLNLLTNSGSIELTLPGDSHGRIEAESLQGKVCLKGSVHREEIREENRLVADLQKPGNVDQPVVTAKTYTGNIKVRA